MNNTNKSHIELIIWGTLLYTFSYNILYPISNYLGHLGGLLGIIMAFYSVFRTNRRFHLSSKGFDRLIISFFLVYILFVILRGFNEPVSINTIITIVTNKKGIIGYLIPFIILWEIKNEDIDVVFKLCYVSAIIGIIFTLINFYEIFFTSHVWIADSSWEVIKYDLNMGQIPGYFILPCSFILMNYEIIPPKYLKVGWVAFLLSLSTSVAYGRRSYIAFHLILLIFIGYIFITSKKKSYLNKIAILSFLVFTALIIVLNYSKISFLEVLLYRFNQDTRSGIELFFLADFYGKTVDWIIGRGIFGEYYCPINFGAYYTLNYRTVVETGYLQFILNGGIIMLALYIYILLKGAFVGIFRSTNPIAKKMGLFLIANILFLVSGNTLEFSFKGVMIWIFVSLLFNKDFNTFNKK